MTKSIKIIYSQYKLLINSCLLIIVAWAINLLVLVGDSEGRGTFGDMFGGLNALFTGLAFATLIYTAWMQKEELFLQREELKATRDELKGQKEQLQQQSATFELQRFESTLFTLLAVHKNNADSLKVYSGKGVHAFKELSEIIASKYHRTHIPDADPLQRIQDIYTRAYSNYHSVLDRYFRHLYHIYKFIDSSNIQNKKWYASIVRAQLSCHEQAVLFYNCLSGDHGLEKFKPLVERYSVFNNMPINLIVGADFKDFYSEDAYK